MGGMGGGEGPGSLFGVPKGFQLASSPTRGGTGGGGSMGNTNLLNKLASGTAGGGGGGGGGSGAVNWQGVQERLSIGDTVGAFAHVVDRGELADLARMMEVVGPRPYLLSASVRNRVYDGIATMLIQDPTGPHTERCLFWCLSLLRGNPGMPGMGGMSDGMGGMGMGGGMGGMGSNPLRGSVGGLGGSLGLGMGGQGGFGATALSSTNPLCSTLAGHTKRDLREALEKAGQEKTKKGLLAALLTRYFV